MRSAYRWGGALVLVLALGVAMLVAGGLLIAGSASGTLTDEGLVPVVAVVDGDTLRVEVDGATERLRIIGLDAPEVRERECLAEEATELMRGLVQDRDVRIAADTTQAARDRYDRILRHVWTLDGRNVAVELIAAGLATEYTYAAPYDGVEAYLAAEEEARSAGLGIWGEACPEPSG